MATIYDPPAAPQPAPTEGAYQPPPAPAVQHTPAEEEYLENLHRELKPQAIAAYLAFYLSRTPAHLQDDMKALIEGDIAAYNPPDPPPENPV